jgi:hypothetical protein
MSEDIIEFMRNYLKLEPVSETQRKILTSSSNRICVAAGRKWGKTYMLGCYVLWFALNRTKEKARVGIFTSSWEQVHVFMDTLRELIDLIDPDLKRTIKITENRGTQMNIEGCEIIARSATKTSRSIRGHGFDLLIIDEAAFIPNEMMAAIRPTRIFTKAKEFLCSTTMGHNHFFKAFNSKVYESYKLKTIDNKYVDKEEVEKERELLTDAEFRQEYEAEFIDDRYSVFPQALIDMATNFNSTFIEAPEPGIDYVVGIDLGRRKDASVIVIAHEVGKHFYVDYVEELISPSEDIFWDFILNRIEEIIVQFRPVKVCIDQTAIGDKPTQDLKNSLSSKNILVSIEGVDFTRRLKNSREGLVNSLLLKFERKEIHFPLCEKLIRQLKNIRFERSESPSQSQNIEGKFSHIGHDDYVSALMLAFYANPQSVDDSFYYCRGENLNTKINDLPQLIVTE